MPKVKWLENAAARREYAASPEAEAARMEAWRTELKTLIPVTDVCYFIGAGDGLVKIGWSSNVQKRLKRLRADCKQPLFEILATSPGGSEAEKYYHSLFASAKHAGEFYNVTPEIEAEIARLKAEAEV